MIIKYSRIIVDPNREGHPEPFCLPTTIPSGWDLSELFATPDLPQVEVSGTENEKRVVSPHDRQTKNPV